MGRVDPRFQQPLLHKLLVLIDGRSVYSRTFSDVFWDLNEVMVSDIDLTVSAAEHEAVARAAE